jgi:Lon protease-like protein
VERRRIIQLLAAGAASLWASHEFDAASLLKRQDLRRPEPLLPLFPLDLVLFPHTNLPLHIFEERYKEMIHDCLENRWEFGMLAVQEQTVKNIGCTASISDMMARFPDGRMNIMVRGGRRFEITELNEEKSYLRGKPQFLDDDAAEPAAEELRLRAIQLYDRLIELADTPTRTLQDAPRYTDTQLSYRLMAAVPADLGWKQSLLELRSEPERLNRVIIYFEKLIEYLDKAPDPLRVSPRKIAG